MYVLIIAIHWQTCLESCSSIILKVTHNHNTDEQLLASLMNKYGQRLESCSAAEILNTSVAKGLLSQTL